MRILLMLADGASYRAVMTALKTTAPTISLWKSRYVNEGVMGLTTLHPGQPPQKLTPALRARILARTQEPPPDGSTHWSLRKMARPVIGGGQGTGAAGVEGSGSETASGWSAIWPARTRSLSRRRRRSSGLVSESAATRGGILRGRKDGDSGAGSQGPAAAVIAGTRRTARVSKYYRHGICCHCSPHFNPQTGNVMGQTAKRVTPAPSS